MRPRPALELRLGDLLELAKPHPCGARRWRVTRLGADIGLVCEGCARRILLERAELERRLVRFVERGPAGAAGEPGPGPIGPGPRP